MADYVPERLLITGGAGFIGSHVVLRLAKLYPQYKIFVMDSLEYCANLKHLSSLKHSPNFKFIKGDVTSADFVRFVLEDEKIDTIMHFAAQTHVDNSFGNAFEFTKNNIVGTHVMLEVARLCSTIRRFVHVSTDEVYGEVSHCTGTASQELATLEPTNPYAASKAAAEMLVKAYINTYKLPCLITRGNNVYGPHQYPEKLVPKCILLTSLGRRMPIHGSGTALRSYLYVEDAAEAFDVLLHKGGVGEVYNLGASVELSTLDVTRSICRYLGRDEEESIEFVEDRLYNDRRHAYFISSAKLSALGWTVRTSWEDGLAKTAEWYKANVLHGEYWPQYELALVPHPQGAASLAVPFVMSSSMRRGS